jgi:hypothetical protein
VKTSNLTYLNGVNKTDMTHSTLHIFEIVIKYINSGVLILFGETG